MPAHLDDAHRKSEVARLLSLLLREEEGLRIAGISGPGGVGKSYLLAHVLAAAGATSQRWLKLSVDGSNESARGDFFGLVDGQLARRKLPPPALPKHDYFSHVRKVAQIHRALLDSVMAELKAGSAPPEIKGAAIALLTLGHRLNQVVPKTREFLDVGATKIEAGDLVQTFDEAWKVVQSLRVLRDSSVLPGPLRDVFGLSYKDRVKTDLHGVTADALVTDLAAAVSGYRKEDRFRLTQAPIAGIERVVLVVDDFEALAPALEEFLVSSLIPKLAEAPFPTLMILLGRDDLEAMHPHWGQHCKKFIRDQIRLAPFDRESALDLLGRAGVPEARREELYRTTQGFPFLLSLLIEELGEAGADSALFLRKFYDRTTRWMSAREKTWFERACYLDKVNLDSLAPLFPDESVEKVQDWFEREASIRDPAASVFQVRPLIREKVLRYLELRSPAKHREMSDRVTKSQAAPVRPPVRRLT